MRGSVSAKGRLLGDMTIRWLCSLGCRLLRQIWVRVNSFPSWSPASLVEFVVPVSFRQVDIVAPPDAYKMNALGIVSLVGVMHRRSNLTSSRNQHSFLSPFNKLVYYNVAQDDPP
jgi:hypothetical protein